jgi:hypothetical protein
MTQAFPFAARLLAKLDELTAPPAAELAVEIAPGRVVAARREGDSLRIEVAALPAEAVQPSAVKPNLRDADAIAAQARAALAKVGSTGGEAALLVPDLTARLSVLEFDALPAKREELAPLARFRLRKSLPFGEEQTVISCQTLSPTRLLVAFGDRARLDEYEDCLEAAGLQAATVLPSGLAALAADPALDHGALLLRAEPGCLTSAFCWQGRIEFYRALEVSTPDGMPSFEDVFPSVAYFRDRVEQTPETAGGGWLLYAAGLPTALQARLQEEAPWATVRAAQLPAAKAMGVPAAHVLAAAGALQGRFA